MTLFFGIYFVFYFLKLSAGRGFWSNALLFCKETERAREDWWAWIIENQPISISVVFNSFDDVNFVKALLGDCSYFEDKTNLLNMDFLLESAKYISYYLQNSIFDPLQHHLYKMYSVIRYQYYNYLNTKL